MKKSGILKKILIVLGVILLPIVSFVGYSAFRYFQDISVKSRGQDVQVIVNSGETVKTIAEKLHSFGWISSKKSFELYARINKKTDFKAGVYSFEGEKSIAEIVEILNQGQIQKTFAVTFLPGGTLRAAKKSLISSGFSESEVENVLSKDYSAEFPALFAGKPADADLEGFLYGETHIFEKGTSAEAVIRRFLGDFEAKVKEMNLAEKFKKQNLTLYEGFKMASIVQKESIGCGAKLECADQKQIAGVFFNRMKREMNLGSDVTYQYIADKTGVARDTQLDSPYNLRVHTGLTPTPIATPSLSALNAAAEPANHDYLFFLSGDDDVTYFGKTDAEHQKNIVQHCQKKCQII